MTSDTRTTMLPARYSRRARANWRPLALVLGIALTALVATIVIVACSGSDPTPTVTNDGNIVAGVTVNGVDIGGLDRAQAEAKLRQSLPDIGSGKLLIRIGALEQDVTYASVSRAYDINSILDQALAYGHDGNPLSSLLGAGPIELTPAVVYNADELARQVNDIVTTAQAAPINATINFENGEYVPTPASDGRSIDGNALLQAATTAIASGVPESTTIDVPVTTIPADISSDAAQNAIAMAQSVTAASLALTAGDDHFTLDSATLHLWVGLEQTAPGQWTLTVDRAAIEAYVATIKVQVDQEAINAEFKINAGGDFVAVAGQVGQTMDTTAATDGIYNALIGRGQGTSTSFVTLPVTATKPEFTTAEAQQMLGDVELLGSWTTKYIPSTLNNMGINIRHPADLIDGTVVMPGDIFSFVGVAGPITEANGYGPGAAIIHGKTKADGVLGGGLCSASTTMFNAALRGGFELGRRSNHAYYISRYPIGLDATIWISGASVHDMTFKNDSPSPIVIQAINKKRTVTFQIYGISDGRTVSLSDPVVTNENPGTELYEFTDTLAPRATARKEYRADGFNSVVTRTVRNAGGQVIHLDTIRSDYRKVDGIILLGRYPGDPPSGTRIPYGPLPPKPGGGGPTPTPGPTDPGGGPTSPHADFSVSQTDADTFHFTNASTGGSLTYDWNFGDGTLHKTGANPNHTYAAPGNYTVTLTVTNSAGTDQATATVHVEAAPTPEPTEPPPDPTPAPSPSAVPSPS